jgi:hypothetical protein
MRYQLNFSQLSDLPLDRTLQHIPVASFRDTEAQQLDRSSLRQLDQSIELGQKGLPIGTLPSIGDSQTVILSQPISDCAGVKGFSEYSIKVNPVHFEIKLSIVVAGIRCQVKRIAEDGCSIDPNLAAEIDRIATEFSDVDINH